MSPKKGQLKRHLPPTESGHEEVEPAAKRHEGEPSEASEAVSRARLSLEMVPRKNKAAAARASASRLQPAGAAESAGHPEGPYCSVCAVSAREAEKWYQDDQGKRCGTMCKQCMKLKQLAAAWMTDDLFITLYGGVSHAEARVQALCACSKHVQASW